MTVGRPFTYLQPTTTNNVKTKELEAGQQSSTARFEITDLISRSGMASIFKAIDHRDRPDGGAQGAAHCSLESDVADLHAASSARRKSAGCSTIPTSSQDPPDRQGEEPALHRDGVSRGPDAR